MSWQKSETEAASQSRRNHSVDTPDGGAAIVQTALDEFGRVDAVVSNAGIFHTAPFDELTFDDWQRMLRVHLDGAFNLSQPAYRAMKTRGYGRFVFITSSAGLFGQPNSAHYAAAKAGTLGLANVIAIEGAEHGIVANCVLPLSYSRMVFETVGARDDVEPDPGFLHAIEPELVVPIVVFLASRNCELTHHNFSACAGRFARVFVGARRRLGRRPRPRPGRRRHRRAPRTGCGNRAVYGAGFHLRRGLQSVQPDRSRMTTNDDIGPGSGPRNPRPETPPRAPGSMRRTSTTDIKFPDGIGGTVVVDIRGRDLRTDDSGDAAVVDELELRISFEPWTASIVDVDIVNAPAALRALDGQPTGACAPDRRAASQDAARRSLCYSVLEDFGGAQLVSGYAGLRARPIDLVPEQRNSRSHRRATRVWVGRSTAPPSHLRDSGRHAVPIRPAAPPLENNDAFAWHARAAPPWVSSTVSPHRRVPRSCGFVGTVRRASSAATRTPMSTGKSSCTSTSSRPRSTTTVRRVGGSRRACVAVA